MHCFHLLVCPGELFASSDDNNAAGGGSSSSDGSSGSSTGTADSRPDGASSNSAAGDGGNPSSSSGGYGNPSSSGSSSTGSSRTSPASRTTMGSNLSVPSYIQILQVCGCVLGICGTAWGAAVETGASGNEGSSVCVSMLTNMGSLNTAARWLGAAMTQSRLPAYALLASSSLTCMLAADGTNTTQNTTSTRQCVWTHV